MSSPVIEALGQDTRYALRGMRKRMGFAATAVLSLGLAMGGTTAMFTVVRAVLLKALPYREPDRLAHIAGGATPSRFAEMKAAAHSFTDLGAFTGEENLTLSGGAEPEVLAGVRVSGNFLKILGAAPFRGRAFLPEEDSAAAAPVVMISSELWQRRFAADPRITGKTAVLADTAYTIIGVLPPRFHFPYAGVDVWMTAPSQWPAMPAKSRALSPFLNIFGRLHPGISFSQAGAELRVLRRQYATQHPAMLDAKPKSPEVTALKDNLVDDVRSMLWMLFGAAAFVLMIACANVAGLLLARATSRSREFAVRAALGAGRPRLIRQMLAESVLLSLTGGALGLLLAGYSLRAIPSITAFDLPRATEVHLDWTVLAFAAGLSVATGVLFGLAPSLGASRPDLIGALRTSGVSASPGAPGGILAGRNLRSLLLVGQVVLSIVLLIGAALLMESIAQLHRVDMGFNPAKLLTMRISLPPVRYHTNPKVAAFFAELIERASALPGVQGATAALSLPMMGYPGTPVQDAGKPLLRLNQRPIATLHIVTPGYFQTLRIPLRRGRAFAAQDREETRRVAIIDQALARRLWPDYSAGVNPVGQHLLVGGVNPNAAEVVGIAADVHQSLEGSAWPESVYESFAQNPQPSSMLAVRTTGDPLSLTRALRDQVRALDRDQTVANVRTMDERVEDQTGDRRLLTILLGTFAGVALLLAVMGIYGVIAYTVAGRTQEVGLRRALGAQPGHIFGLVVRQAMLLTLVGIVIGLAGASLLTRVMSAVLFHVSATDPATFAGIAALFLLVALTASYVPARRAMQIDPMSALRI